MADSVEGHAGHAFFDAVIRANADGRTREDFADPGGARGFSLEDDLAAVIALGKYPDNGRSFHDDESSDILFAHESESVKDQGFWGGGGDVGAFAGEDLTDRAGDFHELLGWITVRF